MGNKLQEFRKKHKITQQDLADNLGVSRQYIRRIIFISTMVVLKNFQHYY